MLSGAGIIDPAQLQRGKGKNMTGGQGQVKKKVDDGTPKIPTSFLIFFNEYRKAYS